MAGLPLIEISANLMRSIVDLLVIISGSSHGILQGTHEAVLAEAQGAQIGPDGFNHLGSMQATLRDVVARETTLNSALGDLARAQPGIAVRVRAILNPLTTQSASYREAMVKTEQMATELARTDGNRLANVVFGEGGTRGEVGRSAKALISTQMKERSQELIGRGIEPRLIPAARSAGTQVLTAIRQLPITIKDAADKVIAVIGAMRVLVTQAARAAFVSGNAALSAALNAVEAAIVRVGSRFTTPIIVINMREIKRAAGIFDPDDGA